MSDKQQISIFETVAVVASDGSITNVKAKIDTGALRTSIDRGLADKLGLLASDNIVGQTKYRNSVGRGQVRQLINLHYRLKDKQIDSIANVSDRSYLYFPLIIGRLDLAGFLIGYDPQTEPETSKF